ncbi:kinase-like protein [Clavulina sp. PMI_390]|nr:kinase-like protein [Clavulina sp. PMI_390]
MSPIVQFYDYAQPPRQDGGGDDNPIQLLASLPRKQPRPVHVDSSEDDQHKNGDGERWGEPTQWPSEPLTEVQTDPYTSFPAPEDDQVWGRLYPCTPDLPLFVCRKPQTVYLVGRGPTCDIIISNHKISGRHCTVSYHPELGVVRIEDHSTNGTYVNGRLVGKGKLEVITGSPEISLLRPGNDGGDDIRFIFRPPSDPNDEVLGGGLYQEYQQLEMLGKGAFGVVHKLHHRETGQLAAAKIFVKTRFLESWENFAHNATREISIMTKLRHPNIVEFFNHYQDTGSFLFPLDIVMELVDGGDLLQHIHQQPGGHMKEPETKSITRLVCQGLTYIHSQGITHRDLKPENILLTRDGMPKIADFGLAKMVDSQTFLKTACGTPAYVAPEVLDDLSTGYSPKVDSWSMAVIVYAMLTGRHAWTEGAEDDFRERLRQRASNLTGILEFEVSQEVQKWIIAMLRSNPEVRLSISEALEHPWLSINDPDSLEPTSVKEDKTGRASIWS